MKKLLVAALLCIASYATAQCCAHWNRVTGNGSDFPTPPCTDFACYVGDGSANRHIATTNACSPDVMWLHRRDNVDGALGLFRTRDMGVGQSMRAAPGDSSFFTNGILDFDATGFFVGNADTGFEENQTGVTYCYYVFHASDGFMAYGTYVGNGVDNTPLVLPFAPEAVLLMGRNIFDPGMRMRTREVTGDKTLRMDAIFLDVNITDDMQAFKSVAGGDAYNGVELGQSANANGRQYFWVAFNEQDPTNWLFTGFFDGNGADGDGTQQSIATGCATDTKMVMSAGDFPSIPSSIRFLARYYRHDAVTTDTTNWAERFNATDVNDEPPGGVDGGFRQLNPTNFVYGNATTAGISHDANILTYRYFYWGICAP